MGKQINFFAGESDRVLILKILNSVFETPIEVPHILGKDFKPFNAIQYHYKYYITEFSQKENVVYCKRNYDDTNTEQVLDLWESPVLEYFSILKNQNGEYVSSRFYCCFDDVEFSKKVSKFFTKLKKEFWYIKKWKMYVSKSIDVENSIFFIPNRTVKITKEDLT